MDVESVKKALLEAAGNPSSGIILEYAEMLAIGIVDAHTPIKEVRVIEAAETR